jgi:hypothetical protein
MKTIQIHGDDWDLDYILAMLEDVKRDKLISAVWQPRDALVRMDGSRATIYTGQDFDPTQYEIKRAFWDHDHCQVCMWTFSKSDDQEQIDGYTDGYNWLCKECLQRFIEGHELDQEMKEHRQTSAGDGAHHAALEK